MPANGGSQFPAVSANGRFVAFASGATNLVFGDTNKKCGPDPGSGEYWNCDDVFVRDRLARTTDRVSVSTAGAQANGASGEAQISADGRFVVFTSEASNLVSRDTNTCAGPAFSEVKCYDVFVRDRVARTTQRVSVSTAGKQGNNRSGRPAISADGRFVAFTSSASNLISGDDKCWHNEYGEEVSCYADIFVRDRVARTTERVSVSSGGVPGNNVSGGEAISADGRFVAFASTASNLVDDDTNNLSDVFVRDRIAGATERVSVGSGGAQANGSSASPLSNHAVGSAGSTIGGGATIAISGDGRFVAFYSDASNLVPGDTNRRADVFVRDRQAGTTERISVQTGGGQANRITGLNADDEAQDVAISADGRLVVFTSMASTLVAHDTNKANDVFVRDRRTGTTTRASVRSSGGGQANGGNSFGDTSIGSHDSAISADGRFVVFASSASNLAAGDTNRAEDIFIQDRAARTTTLLSVGRNRHRTRR